MVSGPLTGHSDWVEAVAFGAAPDGRLIVASGSDEGTIRVWDPLTGTPAGEPLTGHTAAVRSLAFAPGPGGQLASASDDGSVRLWPRPTSAPASRCLPGHAGWVAAVAFTLAPSGTLLLVSGGGDNTVRLWDPRTGACLLVLPRLSPVRSLATSGLLLAIGENEGLSVIELADPTAPDGD